MSDEPLSPLGTKSACSIAVASDASLLLLS